MTMTSVYTGSATQSLDTVLSTLRSLPAPLLPSKAHLHDPSLRDSISSLYLHPSIECLLHILNGDLHSAHFLVRHAQTAPQFESMYAHGILHRIEGDYDNARAWYSNVCETEAFTLFWGMEMDGATGGDEGLKANKKDDGVWYDSRDQKVPGQVAARRYLNEIEAVVKEKDKSKIDALTEQSKRELDSLIEHGLNKYGRTAWKDVSTEWVQPGGELKSKAKDMVTGDSGHRNF